MTIGLLAQLPGLKHPPILHFAIQSRAQSSLVKFSPTAVQAELLELERGEEAATDPDAIITQAGAYKIRTATNGDSAILL